MLFIVFVSLSFVTFLCFWSWFRVTLINFLQFTINKTKKCFNFILLDFVEKSFFFTRNRRQFSGNVISKMSWAVVMIHDS